jgi:hypothetical protein
VALLSVRWLVQYQKEGKVLAPRQALAPEVRKRKEKTENRQ